MKGRCFSGTSVVMKINIYSQVYAELYLLNLTYRLLADLNVPFIPKYLRNIGLKSYPIEETKYIPFHLDYGHVSGLSKRIFSEG